ncbi:FRG domain-containing protein [Vreelandella titanicae]|uniref:FRG domain-containing protein n=1 Tax=Halomonadaceae TaxID=28256 RepID=UPI0013736E24|nr:FRG domain-containing protein [Halomonas sp. ATBC28]
MTIHEEEFENALELINFLSPLNKTQWSRSHIFRGQPCASFVLAPSALRTKGAMAAEQIVGRNLGGDIRQAHYELSLLDAFMKGCDASGIAVPSDSVAIRDRIKELSFQDALAAFQKDDFEWPVEELLPLLATAQHHGVPTCLLDWTKRSYVAAYFACSAALEAMHFVTLSGRLAVWALDISDSRSWESVKYLEMPGSASANLAAQAGVFTVTTLAASYGGGQESVSLENLSDIQRSSAEKPVLTKCTLPITEAPKLLSLCDEFGVKGSTLFPGYEGVAREVRDRAFAGEFHKEPWLNR